MNHPSFESLRAWVPRWSRNHFLLLLLLASLLPGRAAIKTSDPETDYTEVYIAIVTGDELNQHGDYARARDKYVAAQQALLALQQANPNWNSQMVAFRLNYLTEKISATKKAAEVAATKAGSGAAETETPAQAKAEVVLIDAGSEPRTVLRLHPAVGDKQELNMTMKMGMDMSVPGKETPSVDIPAIKFSLSTEVKEVAANGDITYQLTCNEAAVQADDKTAPEIAAAIKASLSAVKNVSGTGKISSRGILLGLQMKTSAADPSMAQIFDQMKDAFSSTATPLPEEAVGTGAKWEHKSKLKSQGMTIAQTFSTELASVDGDRVTLHNSIAQSAANQKVSNPAMPGFKVNVAKMSGSGSGDSTRDLTRLLPVSATMSEKMETQMSLDVGQQKQTMEMKMSMNVTFESN